MRFSRNRLKLNFLFLTIFSFVLFGSFLFIQKVYSLQFIESDHFQDQALSYRERVEVLEAKKSAKNPRRGTARLKHTVTNQKNDIVMTWISNQMLKTKS